MLRQSQRPLGRARGEPPQPGGSRIQTVTVEGLPSAAWLFGSWNVTRKARGPSVSALGRSAISTVWLDTLGPKLRGDG